MFRSPVRLLRGYGPRLFAGLLVVAYLEGVRACVGESFSLTTVLIRWGFVSSTLAGAAWAGGIEVTGHRWRVTPRPVTWVVLLVGVAVLYAFTAHTAAAWALTWLVCVALLVLSSVCQKRRWPVRLLGWGGLAMAGGVLLTVVGQLESRFAEEEFFSALQALVLGSSAALMIAIHSWMARSLGRAHALKPGMRRAVSFPGWMAGAVGLILVSVFFGVTVRAYQRSFYPAQAPSFPGISPQSPFLCGEGTPDATVRDGQETFQRLLDRTAANPDSAAPEYGMLAVATGERRWAEAFRRAILDDVLAARYTGPANSVKYGQALAAQRVYYFARVTKAFPDLWSQEDRLAIRAWLADVNRRALTPEWVDWMYALAFSSWPEGPYENQENGAGLLSTLETYGLGDDALSADNQGYLERNRRGWFWRFRNPDDAYIYQAEWIGNALYQMAYWFRDADPGPDPAVQRRRDLAFEWLLLQAPPDGSPLRYNLPVDYSLAQTAYLGAQVTGDPRYIWWSARMLDWAERAGLALYARPGLEGPLSLEGISPRVGSCLLYGDSGLPTQQGPLAPDKIVFRDGWTADSRYVLLNLRYSGWHRYKATNTITLIRDGGNLVRDNDYGEAAWWLPQGRSQFRDKRIPRENLSGLLVVRTGMSAVLYRLTGLGGPWAQDPPYYASVVSFETGTESDGSHTVLANWRGWQHDRWVHFFHDGGPIVVVDQAAGPLDGQAALAWTLDTESHIDGGRISLEAGDAPAEMLVVPLRSRAGYVELEQQAPAGAGDRVVYRAGRREGRLDVATLFLSGQWVGAQAGVDEDGQSLWIVQGDDKITISLDSDK